MIFNAAGITVLSGELPSALICKLTYVSTIILMSSELIPRDICLSKL